MFPSTVSVSKSGAYTYSRSEKSRPRSIYKRKNFRGALEQGGGLQGSDPEGTGLKLQREEQSLYNKGAEGWMVRREGSLASVRGWGFGGSHVP